MKLSPMKHKSPAPKGAAMWSLQTVLASALLAASLCSGAQAQSLPVSTTLAPPASSYSAAVVYDWYELYLRLIPQTPDYSPPVTARALAAMSLVLYESVVPGMPGYDPTPHELHCGG